MATTSALSSSTIERVRPDPKRDVWLTDLGRRGEGRLVVRVMPAGSRVFYFRTTNAEGKRELIRIGDYVRAAGDAAASFTLRQARDHVAQLRVRHREDRNVKDRLTAERRQRELLSGKSPKDQTFSALLEAYTARLEARGAKSAREVRSAFRPSLYIPQWMLDTRASLITRDHLVAILRPLVKAGKRRQAAKIRSFVRAAFAQAMRANVDAATDGTDFGLTRDPSIHIAQIEGHTTPGHRALDTAELAAWIRTVEDMPEGPVRDALLLCVWLGGQRPTQLLRVRVIDVDLDESSITLSDPKGRRKTARRWALPLTATAKVIVERSIKRAGDSQWLFANAQGVATVPDTLSVAARPLIAKLVADGGVRAAFRLGDVRRSVETRLQALGVSRDVRGYLASHGMGGVQAAHYERYEYQQEVRAALQALSDWIDSVTLG